MKIMIDLEIQSLLLKLWNDPYAFKMGELEELKRLLRERKDGKIQGD